MLNLKFFKQSPTIKQVFNPKDLHMPALIYLMLGMLLYACFGFIGRDPWKNDDLIHIAQVSQLSMQSWEIIWQLLMQTQTPAITELKQTWLFVNQPNYLYTLLQVAWLKGMYIYGINIYASLAIFYSLQLALYAYVLYQLAYCIALKLPLLAQPLSNLNLMQTQKIYAKALAFTSVALLCTYLGAAFKLHEFGFLLFYSTIAMFLVLYAMQAKWWLVLFFYALLITSTHAGIVLVMTLWLLIISLSDVHTYLQRQKNHQAEQNKSIYLHLAHINRLQTIHIFFKPILIIALFGLLWFAFKQNQLNFLGHWSSLRTGNLLARLQRFIYQYPSFSWPLFPLFCSVFLFKPLPSVIKHLSYLVLLSALLYLFDQQLNQINLIWGLPYMAIISAWVFFNLTTSIQRMLMLFGSVLSSLVLAILIGVALLWLMDIHLIYHLRFLSPQHYLQTWQLAIAAACISLWLFYLKDMYRCLKNNSHALNTLFKPYKTINTWLIGSLCIWVSANALYMPAINEFKSYHSFAIELNRQLIEHQYTINTNQLINTKIVCLNISQLQTTQKAALIYHAGHQLQFNNQCAYKLIYFPYYHSKTEQSKINQLFKMHQKHVLLWQSQRKLDQNERFLLWYKPIL